MSAAERDELEAYQSMPTGAELHLRGYGTPEDWRGRVEVVGEDERRTVLFDGDHLEAVGRYNQAVEALAPAEETEGSL